MPREPVPKALRLAFPSTEAVAEGGGGPDTVQRFYERHVFPRWEALVPWERKELLPQELLAGAQIWESLQGRSQRWSNLAASVGRDPSHVRQAAQCLRRIESYAMVSDELPPERG